MRVEESDARAFYSDKRSLVSAVRKMPALMAELRFFIWRETLMSYLAGLGPRLRKQGLLGHPSQIAVSTGELRGRILRSRTLIKLGPPQRTEYQGLVCQRKS